MGSGPIASMLVNRYGCRVVTAVGAVLAAFGLAISAAANSLVLLYFSIGVCTGKMTIFLIHNLSRVGFGSVCWSIGIRYGCCIVTAIGSVLAAFVLKMEFNLF